MKLKSRTGAMLASAAIFALFIIFLCHASQDPCGTLNGIGKALWAICRS